MNKSWRSTTLRNLLKIEHGYAFKGEYFSESGHYVLLTPGNFYEEGGFKLRPGKDRSYSGEIPERYILPKGSMIVAMTEQAEGLLGSPAIMPESNRFLHNQRLGLVIPKANRADTNFLYHLFNTNIVRQQIRNSSSGAKVRHTSPERIYRVKVTIPRLPTQRKIAAILTAYDDLIETNKRRIALLEKMAEEIYREWFVRMRFPGYKNTKFVKGVPEGWHLRRFSELVQVNPRESVHKDELAPHVGMEDLSESSMHFISKEERKGAAGSKFRNRDTLLPRITPCLENGKRGFVTCLKEQQVGIGSTEFIVFREKILPAEYIYLISCHQSFRQHAELSMTGASGRQRVQNDCFTYFFVLTPPKNIREQFSAIARPLFDSISLYARENLTLTQTRDLLLPRLISGKLSVEDLDIQFPPSMCEDIEDAHQKG